MKHRFQVYNTNIGDSIAIIEMPEELLSPDAKILDPDTQTLRHIKGGGIYTLIPIDDHKVTILRRIKKVYKDVTETPAKMFSTHISRMDQLIDIVGLFFGEVSYVVVDNKEDLNNLINPPRDKDYEPKTVKYNVIDDLLKAAGVETKMDDGHTCGPECNHDEAAE